MNFLVIAGAVVGVAGFVLVLVGRQTSDTRLIDLSRALAVVSVVAVVVGLAIH